MCSVAWGGACYVVCTRLAAAWHVMAACIMFHCVVLCGVLWCDAACCGFVWRDAASCGVVCLGVRGCRGAVVLFFCGVEADVVSWCRAVVAFVVSWRPPWWLSSCCGCRVLPAWRCRSSARAIGVDLGRRRCVVPPLLMSQDRCSAT